MNHGQSGRKSLRCATGVRDCVSRGEIGGQFRGEKGAINLKVEGTGSRRGTGIHGRSARSQASLRAGASAAKVVPFLTATNSPT